MSWKLPPSFVRVKAPQGPALWLPLILLWPLILILFALLLCLALPAAALLRAPPRSLFAVVLQIFRLSCALHGTAITLSVADRDAWEVALF